MFKKMGGNIPGGNFLGGNFPGGIFQGGVWWVGIFRVGIFQVGVFLIPSHTYPLLSQRSIVILQLYSFCTANWSNRWQSKKVQEQPKLFFLSNNDIVFDLIVFHPFMSIVKSIFWERYSPISFTFTEAVVQRCSVKKVFLEILLFRLRPATLLKKRLWHRCLPVNFTKFLWTPFFTKHHRWLLLHLLRITPIIWYRICNFIFAFAITASYYFSHLFLHTPVDLIYKRPQTFLIPHFISFSG